MTLSMAQNHLSRGLVGHLIPFFRRMMGGGAGVASSSKLTCRSSPGFKPGLVVPAVELAVTAVPAAATGGASVVEVATPAAPAVRAFSLPAASFPGPLATTTAAPAGEGPLGWGGKVTYLGTLPPESGFSKHTEN